MPIYLGMEVQALLLGMCLRAIVMSYILTACYSFHLTIPSKHGDQRGLLPGDYVLMESKHRVADSTTVLDQILSSHSHPALPPSLLPAQRFHGSGTCMEFPR